MTSVLIAGGTGMLGRSIASHLLDQPDVDVRLLVRDSSPGDPGKEGAIQHLVSRGASIVAGDVSDPASLDQATQGVDVVISALQGRSEIIVDGQVALAEAAVRNGVRRFFPSDFAIDLFAAPDGAPQFDLRKQADAIIDALPLQVVHVLNGAFMDMMLDPETAGIVNLQNNTARLWGTGDEPFNLTTVDDTAHFTALLATDPADISGVRAVSGAETTFNTIIAETERLADTTLAVQILGDADDLRRITAEADDPWSVIRQWYFLSMITVPPLPRSEVKNTMARSDVFVAPAVLESFGIAALEAHAAGLPVVGRRGTGCRTSSATARVACSSAATARWRRCSRGWRRSARTRACRARPPCSSSAGRRWSSAIARSTPKPVPPAVSGSRTARRCGGPRDGHAGR